MRRYARTRDFLAAVSILAIAFVVPPAALSVLSAEALAQSKSAAESKTTTSTSADSTYGEGGTLTTVSDDMLRLVQEVFRDKNGNVREIRLYYTSGNIEVSLLDEMGKRVGWYGVTQSGNSGNWYFETWVPGGAKTYSNGPKKDDALKQGLDASKNFATIGEFPPLLKTNVEAPKLAPAESPVKTILDQPQIQSKEIYKDPPSKEQPKTATGANGTQSAAPKTCGEITDQRTLIAMGCDSRPAPRAAVAAPRTGAPQVTPAANRSQSDCFSDPVCADQLKAQELLRERERSSGSGKGGPDYPPVDLPVPGGIPLFSGK